MPGTNLKLNKQLSKNEMEEAQKTIQILNQKIKDDGNLSNSTLISNLEQFDNVTIDYDAYDDGKNKSIDIYKNFTRKFHHNFSLSENDDFELDIGLHSFFADLLPSNPFNMIFGIVTFLLICSFCYYIPRMIFFRISRFSQDRQNPNFFLIILLSCIAVIGAIVHILAVADGISQWVESMKLLFAMKFESENQNNHEMIFYYLKVSFNRLVTPIVAIYLIQQIVLNTNYLPKKYFNLTVQATLSAICASLIFSYSIQNFAEEASKIDDSFHFKPDPLPSFLDIIPPVIAISLFFVAKKTLKRSTTYLDRSNPSSSTTIDFVSKVITWQTIMLIFTSFSYFTSLSDPVASFFSEAILSQHSPMIHYVLLRSLLRARKSTRFCCLLICCTDDEKVADLSTIEKRNRLPPVKQNNGIQIDNKDKNDLGQDSLEEKTKNN